MLFHKFAESLGKREDLTLIGRFHLQVLVNGLHTRYEVGHLWFVDRHALSLWAISGSTRLHRNYSIHHDLLQVINIELFHRASLIDKKQCPFFRS